MRYPLAVSLLLLAAAPLLSQGSGDGPTSEKAQKAFNEASEHLRKYDTNSALSSFRKADKEDGGRCLACQKKVVKYAIELQDWKTAQNAASEMIAEAQGDKSVAMAHYQLGVILFDEALGKHKDDLYSRAHTEFTQALTVFSSFPSALLDDGKALAHLKQDDAAKTQFQKYLELHSADDPSRRRALRFINEPGLARARMVPPFAVETLDGQHLSMDDLQGKVILLDFWATWCGPCREAMPHMREIAKKFQGQPFVILSVSLDSDENKWKDYVAKNEMTWLHYRDGGFTGPIANLFGVRAIPQTFTIDSDGVLQDQHIGDASVEGKLKKLIARAQEPQQALK